MPKCIYLRIGKESKWRRADHNQDGAEPARQSPMVHGGPSNASSPLVGDLVLWPSKRDRQGSGNPRRWFRGPARCWSSSFAKCERPERTQQDADGLEKQWIQSTIYAPEQVMTNDLETRTGVPAPIISRRKFTLAAAAGIAGMFPASLGSLTAQGTAMKARQLVLPTATKDVTPFKIQVP